MVLYIILGLFGRFRPDGIEVLVQPNSQMMVAQKDVTVYPACTLKLIGVLHISHPTVLQQALFPDTVLGIDLITLLCICLGCILIVLIIPKLNENNLFRNDISLLIIILGYLIIFHSVFSIYRMVAYIPNEIAMLTNHEYVTQNKFPIFVFAEAYMGLLVIAISYMFKRGLQLQEELDLTV
ncbi:MAG: DUF2975 domain-containing protein [Sediminibacterium sp.]|nr:MAG: DUF2975 domain-containing protein [Sediminibacterium sp.]